MSKNNKRIKNTKKQLIMMTSFTTLAIIVIITIICVAINNIESYKIEPRVDRIESYEKVVKEKNESYSVNGWLRVQGTNIDYPVIFADDSFDVNIDIGDYVWSIESEDKLLNRTVILGHNIRNVSQTPLIANKDHTRFEQLLSFIYYDFAKDNQFIQYTKDGKNYIYQIFAVSLIDEYDLPLSGNMRAEDQKKYIEDSIKNSYFKYDVDVKSDDKIISLITCTRFYGETKYRFKIDGKLLADNEKIKLRKVSKNKNYEEIEGIIRGGEENE